MGKDEHLFGHPGRDLLLAAHPFPSLQSECSRDPVVCPCVGPIPWGFSPSPSSHHPHCRPENPSCSGNQWYLVSMVKQVDETLQAVSYRSGSPKSTTKSEEKESFIWQQPSWKEVAGNAGCLWRRARRGEASPGWRGVDGQCYTRTSLPEHLYFPPALRLQSELCVPGPSTSCTGLAQAPHQDQPEASLPQLPAQVTTTPGEHQAHLRAEPRSLTGCGSWHGQPWHPHTAAVCKPPGGRWHVPIHACQRGTFQPGWWGEPCTPLRCPQTHPSSSFCLPQTRLSISHPTSLCTGMKLWRLAWSSTFTHSHRLGWALCGIFAAA